MNKAADQRGNRGAATRWPPLGPIIMAVGIVVVLVYVFTTSLGFAILRVRLNPLLFAGLTLLVALLILVQQLRNFKTARRVLANGEEPNRAVEEAGLEGGYLERGEIEGLIWFAVLVATFVVLGFIVGMTAFMILFLRIYGRESWTMTLGLTVGTMTVLYFLFIDFLGVRIYPGMFSLPIPFLS